MTQVVNLYGGPGTGKSTIAAELFSSLKWRGINCELVTEYAKDKVWEGSTNVLEHQIYIFAKQLFRTSRLLGKVDYIITDSPILLSLVYGENESNEFRSLVLAEHRKLNNINIFLQRNKLYRRVGRLQTEQEAMEIDYKIRDMLREYEEDNHVEIIANNKAATLISDHLCYGSSLVGT